MLVLKIHCYRIGKLHQSDRMKGLTSVMLRSLYVLFELHSFRKFPGLLGFF